MKRRLAIALFMASCGLLAGAGAAAADTRGDVTDVRVDPGARTVDLRLSANALPAGAGIDPFTVTVTIGGRRVRAVATPVATSVVRQAARVVLAVDTSGSMQGAPLRAATDAMKSFVTAVPRGTSIGVVAFSAEPRLVLAPTTDQARVIAALSTLRAGGETALYDALPVATRALGPKGPRRLVLLSDGGDTRSRGTLAVALADIKASGAQVAVIGFKTDEEVAGVLKQVAAAGHGQLLRANDTATLASALRSAARSYATELNVHVVVPAGVAVGSSDLVVWAAGSAGPVVAATQVSFAPPVVAPPAQPTEPTATPWIDTSGPVKLGAGSIALALLLGFFALVGGSSRQTRRTQKLVEDYTVNAKPAPKQVRDESIVARSALEMAERFVESRDWTEKLALRLERANVSMSPGEWVLVQVGVSFGIALLFALFGASPIFAIVFGLVVGPLGSTGYLRFKASRRRKAFDSMLPDTLQLIAGSLSAGYSLPQALDGVIREGTQPVAAEFGRALAESRIGIPVETALESVADRMGSRDMRWVVMSIRIQREVGGNLAGVLLTVAGTMREREMLRRHIRALAAEGRLSAYILVGLPILLVLYEFLVRRDYLRPLYTTGMGIAMSATALIMMGIGSLWMKKIVAVEI